MRLLLIIVLLIVLLSCKRDKQVSQNEMMAAVEQTVADSSENTEVDELYYGYRPDSLEQMVLSASRANDSSWLDTHLNESAKLFIDKMEEIRGRKAIAQSLHLPENACIIDIEKLSSGRTVILWVANLRADITSDDDYTCPSVVTGTGWFYGKGILGLIDTRKNRVIHSLPLPEDIEYPFAILNPDYARALGGLKYCATGGDSIKPGKARLLCMDDYNGDGNKAEFAFYMQYSCVASESTLYGYSPVNDSLVHYKCILNVTAPNYNFTADTTYIEETYWPDHAFEFKIGKGDSLIFEMDYRGRGGTLDRYALHYNRQKEMFEGTLHMLTEEQTKEYGFSFYNVPRRKK